MLFADGLPLTISLVPKSSLPCIMYSLRTATTCSRLLHSFAGIGWIEGIRLLLQRKFNGLQRWPGMDWRESSLGGEENLTQVLENII